MIKRDFLSPLFLAGLYPDLTQRLLPGGLLPDRASAIEQAWEVTWAKTFPKAPNRFEEPFHALWAEPGGWHPVLLINGTSVKSGRRIITSNIRLGDDFADAIDFFERTGREVRLSTAIHNSARFPILDAAGTVANGEGASLDLDVDGGYFENFGATTASDAMERLRRIAHERGRSIHFVVIQISSDPELATESGRNEAWSKEVSRGVRVGSDVSAPAITFWQTRDGLGFQATEALRRRVEAFGTASYAHFRLRDDKEPMSWFLSNVAVCRLNREWAANAREVETVDRVLRPAVWAAGAPATPVPQPCAGDEPGAAGVRR